MSRIAYQSVGLNDRDAAEHLLRRFANGPTPEAVDDVLEQGIENWVGEQLVVGEEDPWMHGLLCDLPALSLDNRSIARLYPDPGQVRKEAVAKGVISGDQTDAQLRQAIKEYARTQGYRPQHELIDQLTAARLLRAVHARGQIAEVWFEFWRNHFYVSARDRQARPYLVSYERDALRPRLWGRFDELLLASAQHPAMLLYLDNARSAADPGRSVLVQRKGRRRGLNENYARELLELHTLGVDGGYCQQDVEEQARVLTGWTVLPGGERGRKIQNRIIQARIDRSSARRGGFVLREDFLFDASAHDAESKLLLARHIPGGGGLEEGEETLRWLARHPATAQHLAYKLAVHFVAENPSRDLVDQLAANWLGSTGDLVEMLWAILAHPEFWHQRRCRVRSPLQLAAAAVRASGGRVEDPVALVKWVRRMGQPLYRYAAPTGWPDSDRQWIGAGTLVQRVDFLTALGRGTVEGVEAGSYSINLTAPEFQLR